MCDSAQMDLGSDFMCFDTKYEIYCLHFENEDSARTSFCSLSHLYLKVLPSPILLSRSASKKSLVKSAVVANAEPTEYSPQGINTTLWLFFTLA